MVDQYLMTRVHTTELGEVREVGGAGQSIR
jgi:hypothetical protein